MVGSERRRPKPPGGVRFAGWMIGIGAAFAVLIGFLFILVGIPEDSLERIGTTRGIIQLSGFIVLAIGLLEFLLIYALYDGSRVARIIVTVLVGLNLLGSLTAVITDAPGAFLSWVQGVISIAILIGLWATPDASEFFRKPPSPPPAIPPPPVS
jgi:hypothetical protein